MEESSDTSESSEPIERLESNADIDSLESKVLEEPAEQSSSNAGNYFKKADGNLKYKISKSAHNESDGEKSGRERSINGAVAIIYYSDEATGTVEFLFEQKPANYGEGKGKDLENQRGLLSPIGGAIDIVDGRSEDGLEALMRELDEEVGEEKAKSIIRNTLDATRDLYDVIPEEVDGEVAFTYVYAIKITSREKWAVVKKAYLADDSGPARVLSGKDVERMKAQDFAFTFGKTVLDLLREINENIKRHYNLPATEIYRSGNPNLYNITTQSLKPSTHAVQYYDKAA